MPSEDVLVQMHWAAQAKMGLKCARFLLRKMMLWGKVEAGRGELGKSGENSPAPQIWPQVKEEERMLGSGILDHCIVQGRFSKAVKDFSRWNRPKFLKKGFRFYFPILPACVILRINLENDLEKLVALKFIVSPKENFQLPLRSWSIFLSNYLNLTPGEGRIITIPLGILYHSFIKLTEQTKELEIAP